MKVLWKSLASALLLIVTTASAPAETQKPESWVYAWCAGGPAKPTYAFYSYNRAQSCSYSIAHQSQSCARYVRVGRCHVQNWFVGDTQPNWCQCGPFASRNIGYWY